MEDNNIEYKKCDICFKFECRHQTKNPKYTQDNKVLTPVHGITTNSFKNYRKSNYKSLFLKQGELNEYLRKDDLDKLFPFQNFKTVKLGKNTHVLGTGTYGRVYLSQNTVDNKFYSIKEISKEKIRENDAESLIMNEIEIHPKLTHENIIKLYNYWESDTSYYLILEYASKGSLFELIKSTNNKGVSEKEAFKYFIQTASAVHFLHDNKVVHRDIKPENILLDESYKVKLCDFGWCVELTCGNRNSFCGTYEYMSPEMVSESPYNFSVDIWAIGVLLYELLHGYPPFRSKSNDDDYYKELFSNISKKSLKVDKEISENCHDLLNSK